MTAVIESTMTTSCSNSSGHSNQNRKQQKQQFVNNNNNNNNKKIYRNKVVDWFCQPCNVYCNSHSQFEFHLISQKHKAVLEELHTKPSETKTALVEEQSEIEKILEVDLDPKEDPESSLSAEDTTKDNATDDEKGVKTTDIKTEEKLTREAKLKADYIRHNLIAQKYNINAAKYFIPDAKKKGKYEKFGFYCATCDVPMTGQIQLVMHVRGAKHQFFSPFEMTTNSTTMPNNLQHHHHPYNHPHPSLAAPTTPINNHQNKNNNSMNSSISTNATPATPFLPNNDSGIMMTTPIAIKQQQQGSVPTYDGRILGVHSNNNNINLNLQQNHHCYFNHQQQPQQYALPPYQQTPVMQQQLPPPPPPPPTVQQYYQQQNGQQSQQQKNYHRYSKSQFPGSSNNNNYSTLTPQHNNHHHQQQQFNNKSSINNLGLLMQTQHQPQQSQQSQQSQQPQHQSFSSSTCSSSNSTNSYPQYHHNNQQQQQQQHQQFAASVVSVSNQ